MLNKVKTKARWMERSRKGSRYWSGVSGTAKGWCIFTRSDQFILGETGEASKTKGVRMVRTPTGIRTAKRFGPFSSFEAAKAAHSIMHDMD